jgi:hypothetical protein
MNQAKGHGKRTANALCALTKEKRSRKQEQFIAALLSYPAVEAPAKASAKTASRPLPPASCFRPSAGRRYRRANYG